MKILFEELTAPQRSGGIESATTGLVKMLETRGIQVVRSSEISETDQEIAPDCVHLHGIWSPVLARRWWEWKRRGVPCLTTVHGMLEPWALAHKHLKKQVAWHSYQKLILNRMNLLHVTSEREGRNLRALGLQPPITLIPWGIEMPADAEEESKGLKVESRKSENEKRGLKEIEDMGAVLRKDVGETPTLLERKTALFVGRLFPVKGLPMLIDAWARLRPEGWQVRLVGPDEAGHRVELESQIARAGLNDVFEFTGSLEGEALQQAYAAADLLVMPSHTENFGMSVAEGMSHGLPVITTHGTPWKLLEEERCGWWVPISVDGIADALNDATCRSPEELAAMGERGRKVVAERFAWDKIAADFIACYEWMLAKEAKPACVQVRS